MKGKDVLGGDVIQEYPDTWGYLWGYLSYDEIFFFSKINIISGQFGRPPIRLPLNMMTYLYWRHKKTRDIYAVRVDDASVLDGAGVMAPGLAERGLGFARFRPPRRLLVVWSTVYRWPSPLLSIGPGGGGFRGRLYLSPLAPNFRHPGLRAEDPS
jgi:hypothetical protein